MTSDVPGIYRRLRDAVAELDDAVDARDTEAARLQAVVAARATAVADLLAELAPALDEEGVPMDLALARSLYWQQPEVKVAALSVPLRVHAGEVYRTVGPIDDEIPCRGGCGTMLRYTATSRQGSNSRGNVSRYCDPCTEHRQRQWASGKAHRADDEDLWSGMRDALASDAPLRPRVVEFEGVRGTWVIDEDGRPLRPL